MIFTDVSSSRTLSHLGWQDLMAPIQQDDTVITSTIYDWLLHHNQVLNIQGESYRLWGKHEAGLFNSHHLN